MSTINASINKSLVAFSKELLQDTITSIAIKHNLNVEDTIREFMPKEFSIQEKKSPEKKSTKHAVKADQPKFVLPWCGESKDGWCQGIRANYGLYTQCTMTPMNGELYCKTCTKNAGSNGIPQAGNVQLRKNVGLLDYREPSGKKVTLYTAFMKKNNISRDDVIREAAKFDITVPECHFTTVSSGRGRPKKDNNSSDQKKKPGRPKKISDDEPQPDDLIADALNFQLSPTDDDF
tara:strand:- start:245 stop:946 length:702 start_codon:yes stop_codon:yes gene_type:complete